MKGMSGLEVTLLAGVMVLAAVLMIYVAANWAQQGARASDAVERAVFGNVLAGAANALSAVDAGEVRLEAPQEVSVKVADNDIEVSAGEAKTTVDNALVAAVSGSVERASAVCVRKAEGSVEVTAC